jgi:hypothetical protein
MALNQILVGPQNLVGDGTTITARAGRQGDTIVSELHGRYYENAYRKNIYVGSNGAVPSVTTVALATTYTGLALINPQASTVNLTLLKVGYSFLVAFPAAATIGLMAGFAAGGVTTFSAAATDGANTFVGGPRSQGRACLSATLVGSPFLHTVFGSGLTGAITTTPDIQQIVDMEGSVVIPPGGYVAIYTSTVSGAASLAGSFMWEENSL